MNRFSVQRILFLTLLILSVGCTESLKESVTAEKDEEAVKQGTIKPAVHDEPALGPPTATHNPEPELDDDIAGPPSTPTPPPTTPPPSGPGGGTNPDVVGGGGVERHYFVAAEIVQWNYIPTALNQIEPSLGVSPWGDVATYKKYRFIEYTDASYTQPKLQPRWMGILGPELRGTLGDVLVVHFTNRSDRPLSMHPHGVGHDVANDGADFEFNGMPGAHVAPGGSFVYRWYVDESSMPGPGENVSSKVWMYHSAVDAVGDIYAGLIGTIIVTKPEMIRGPDNLKPIDVDHEYTALFMVFDEEGGEEGGLMHAMNGYLFGNLEGYVANVGHRIRWHVLGLGTEVDLHTAHWHGNTVITNTGVRTDVIELMPASMISVTMLANNPGHWLFHCHVADHMTAGMMARYNIQL